MRAKTILQPELYFDPPNLKITEEFYAKYERISQLLDDNPGVLNLVHGDLEPLAEFETPGRARYASDTVLRLAICQVVEGLSLRQTVVRVDTCAALRRFVRVDAKTMMDYSTFCRLRNAIQPETWHKINRLLAEYAVEQGTIRGEALRIDTTAVETNIHWPTDSSLLVDVYQTIKRDLDHARGLGVMLLVGRRFHLDAVRKLALRILRKSGRRGSTAKGLKSLYKRLIRQIEEILAAAGAVAGWLRERGASSSAAGDSDLAERLIELEQLGRQVVSQARRRVLEGESVPNDEKLFSVFEPHTELLIRGKAGKPVEFGHMIQIQQVEEKFITDYAVFDRRPPEPALLAPALASHRALFGRDPVSLAADKGYFDRATVEDLEQRIATVSIAKKGKRSPAEIAREHDPIFRHAQRFRAGVEGTISFLKRVLGLSRCYAKGWTHFQSTVGTGIFVHNLLLLARS